MNLREVAFFLNPLTTILVLLLRNANDLALEFPQLLLLATKNSSFDLPSQLTVGQCSVRWVWSGIPFDREEGDGTWWTAAERLRRRRVSAHAILGRPRKRGRRRHGWAAKRRRRETCFYRGEVSRPALLDALIGLSTLLAVTHFILRFAECKFGKSEKCVLHFLPPFFSLCVALAPGVMINGGGREGGGKGLHSKGFPTRKPVSLTKAPSPYHPRIVAKKPPTQPSSQTRLSAAHSVFFASAPTHMHERMSTGPGDATTHTHSESESSVAAEMTIRGEG